MKKRKTSEHSELNRFSKKFLRNNDIELLLKIKKSKILWIIFPLIFLSIVVLVIFLIYFQKVLRIYSVADFYELCRVVLLPQYSYRCKLDSKSLRQELDSSSSVTACLRCLPSVFFIGASKCGTTSLTDYLDQNPSVHFTNRFIHKRDSHREVHR